MTEQFTFLLGDTAGSIYFDAPEGRPSSVTSLKIFPEVGTDDDEEASAFGSASIESINTTVDASSGPSETYPDRLYVTATTGIVAGRDLLVTNAATQSEWVRVEGVVSGDYLILQNNLVYTHASGATVQSTRMSATINSTWCADTDNLSNPLRPTPKWRAVFDYVVSSKNYRSAVFFDLVRYPFTCTVTPAQVDEEARGWLFKLPTDDQKDGGEQVIKSAIRQVKLDLWERNVSDYALRNSVVVQDLVLRKAVVIVDEAAVRAGGGAAAQAAWTLDNTKYWDRVNNLVTQAKAHAQASETGSAGVTRRSPIWRK